VLLTFSASGLTKYKNCKQDYQNRRRNLISGFKWSGGTGLTKNDQLIQQLVEGQKELKTDVAVLKTDVALLKEGQEELKTDVALLKEGQEELKTDVASLKEGQEELRTDVAELKTDVAELKEGQNKLTAVVINIENILLTKLNVLFDADSSRRVALEMVREDQSAQYKKLEEHEMRILRLEKAEKDRQN
jgi:chromosome segregation ATPase